MTGWIKLHRQLLGSDMYRSLNSTQRDVMIQVLLSANHKTNQWEWKGKLFKCKPGQFTTSLKTLKNKCASNVTVQNIRTALIKLETWEFLTNKSTKTGRLITILNWDAYQGIHEGDQQSNQQTANKELTTNKNDKELKNIYMCHFDEFWKVYPPRNGRKLGKKESLGIFVKIREDELENVVLAAKNYAVSKDVQNVIGIRDPKRFLKDDSWKEWVNAVGTKRFDEIGH